MVVSIDEIRKKLRSNREDVSNPGIDGNNQPDDDPPAPALALPVAA
jgi:hypothetical protein